MYMYVFMCIYMYVMWRNGRYGDDMCTELRLIDRVFDKVFVFNALLHENHDDYMYYV